jgi:hypothetical protein
MTKNNLRDRFYTSRFEIWLVFSMDACRDYFTVVKIIKPTHCHKYTVIPVSENGQTNRKQEFSQRKMPNFFMSAKKIRM